jgi:hypothetical protein
MGKKATLLFEQYSGGRVDGDKLELEEEVDTGAWRELEKKAS